jgi:hypothetical protein
VLVRKIHLHFVPENVEPILAGRKRETFRLVEEEGIEACRTGDSVVAVTPDGKVFANLRVVEIEELTVESCADHAVGRGRWSDPSQAVVWFSRTYGRSVDLAERVWLIRFSLIELT